MFLLYISPWLLTFIASSLTEWSGPKRFEAGTPAIGEAIGLGAAIDYLSCIGMDQIHEYEVNTRSVSLCHILLWNICFIEAYCTLERTCDSVLTSIFWLSRKSWQPISMKALFQFQMSWYMVQHLPKQITVLLYALSMLRMFILQILQKFLISRYAEVSTVWFVLIMILLF